MSKPTLPSPADAAETAGVRIVPLDDMALVGAAADLSDRVWATTDLMRTNLIRAVEQAGGYAVGALDPAPGWKEIAHHSPVAYADAARNGWEVSGNGNDDFS